MPEPAAASGRTISDLMKLCSLHPEGTTSQQRSTLPVTGRGTVFAGNFRFRIPGFIAVRTQELVSKFEPFSDVRPGLSLSFINRMPSMLTSMNQLIQTNGTPRA